MVSHSSAGYIPRFYVELGGVSDVKNRKEITEKHFIVVNGQYLFKVSAGLTTFPGDTHISHGLPKEPGVSSLAGMLEIREKMDLGA